MQAYLEVYSVELSETCSKILCMPTSRSKPLILMSPTSRYVSILQPKFLVNALRIGV